MEIDGKTASPIHYRRLGPDDTEVWRQIRLEALQAAPEAFGQTFEHAVKQPIDSFTRTVSGTNPLFAAFDGLRPIGSAGIYVIEGPKSGHRGMLWGMYVAAGYRGRGVGEGLIEAVIAAAPPAIEQVHLRVVAGNDVAYRLYRRLGFEPYGIEPGALRFNGRDYDEVMMLRLLRRQRSGG